MPFKKGQSGNPKGRPPGGTSVAEYIRQRGGTDGRTYVDTLHQIATNRKESTRLRIESIKILLYRGYGRPPDEVHSEEEHTFDADAIRSFLDAEGFLCDQYQTPSDAADEDEVVKTWLASRPDWPPPRRD